MSNYTISGAINKVLPAGDIFTKLAPVSLNGHRMKSPHRGSKVHCSTLAEETSWKELDGGLIHVEQFEN